MTGFEFAIGNTALSEATPTEGRMEIVPTGPAGNAAKHVAGTFASVSREELLESAEEVGRDIADVALKLTSTISEAVKSPQGGSRPSEVEVTFHVSINGGVERFFVASSEAGYSVTLRLPTESQ